MGPHKQIKVNPESTIVLESDWGYLSVFVDWKGRFEYHTEQKEKEAD